jgi:hypothetical protein
MSLINRYATALIGSILTHQLSLYCFANRNDFIYKEIVDEKLPFVGIIRVCCDPEIIFIHKQQLLFSATVPAQNGRVMSFYSKSKFADVSKRFNQVVDAIKGCYGGSLLHRLLCVFKRRFLEIRSSELQRQMSEMLSKH